MSNPLSRRRQGVFAIKVVSSLFLVLPLAASCGSTVDQQVISSSGGTTTGAGGDGGGGGEACVPDTLVECYSGPGNTEGVGVCHGGAKKCAPDGASFGPCQWEVTPTADDCKTPEDEDCDGLSPACPGETVWGKAFGGDGNQYSQRIAIDPSGNLIVVGGFNATFKLGAATLTPVGQSDFFVAKFDPTGKPLWAKGFGSAAEDFATDVDADPSGGILITGSVGGNVDLGDGPLAGFGENDIFILKLDADGQFMWRKMLGSPGGDAGYGITADPAGNVIATGGFHGTINFGAGDLTAAAADIYVAKYDAAGVLLWARRFGGPYEDYGSDVAGIAGGDILITGGFYGPMDLGGGSFFTLGGYDSFVARLDAAGEPVWATQLKGTSGMGNFPITYSVAGDPTGAAIVSGYFKGTVDLGGDVLASAGGTDAFLAKYDGADGKHVFSRRFGGPYMSPGQPDEVTDAAFAVAADGAGNIMVTGAYFDSIDLGGGPLSKQPYGDVFVGRFDPTGEHLFSKSYGTSISYAVGSGVAVTSTGNAVITGYFVGTIDFGLGPLSTPTTQDTDIFLAEIAP